MIERIRQFMATTGAILAACLGCAFVSVLLVQIPLLQSNSSSNAGQAFGAASAASTTAALFYMARTMRMQKKESELQRLALQYQLEALEAQCDVAGLSRGELHRTSEALIRGLHMSILKRPWTTRNWPPHGRFRPGRVDSEQSPAPVHEGFYEASLQQSTVVRVLGETATRPCTECSAGHRRRGFLPHRRKGLRGGDQHHTAPQERVVTSGECPAGLR